ncbi:Mpv17/PMP22 family protein [Skeletonema marinoi]|uniref:Mpv17/PMP22 family protein n=1 Tax=Skeletonema marinoi TaxID=267567 RepID=A0AAD8YIC6_9STRA|nr:Mpv17/PMP22 family protein [Skeletonema marinoi]
MPYKAGINELGEPALATEESPLILSKSNAAGLAPLFRDPTGAIPGFQAYSDALDKNPVAVKALTSLVGWLLGDLIAQVFISGGSIDYMRLVTLCSFGFVFHGPSGHYFYYYLDEIIPGTDAVHVCSKVVIDQLAWCPVFMSVFFLYLGLVNGDSFATIGNKIKNDLFNACLGSWKVWPIAHLINFKFIPNKWRIPYINAVQIAFNIFLSLLGNKKA